ncbi:MAG: bifunctional DNA-formamidopyrimidine glycosylase/DNA-(apurinic or apyrimidinic site) lyase [Nevskiaceae bacterium]|nr:MAG: bifunctional DNA-formamidopyrimidine glycosylase/DNA-(apurinic or apyrimidinic site) lyase [Nevskiaceae bacterium]TBR74262.1 MAG: bifunctional DNA-formamidopyrimidine glycosylase/DNA-(apurinic or apyrimidinic site) lyase [Nevskiaceae bacterium]
MPELPEVETVRRGLAPLITGRRFTGAVVRQPQLRQPVPADLGARIAGKRVDGVERRGKYLLIRASGETLLVHLGMSGRLRVLTSPPAPDRHDHVDLLLDGADGGGLMLRFHDPRRFGLILLCEPQGTHPLLANIGPEPLGDAFNGDYLFRASRGHRVAVKNFIMDSHVVAGVGNIYASEALFRAGIRPQTAAGRVSHPRYGLLAAAIRGTLEQAIACGGTTLRDFIGVGGHAGYFKQELQVYGRAGELCRVCGSAVKQLRIGQRSTFYCSVCQH